MRSVRGLGIVGVGDVSSLNAVNEIPLGKRR